MQVSEKNARIWRSDYKNKDGSKTFTKCSVGLSKKKEDGSYYRMYIDVAFAKRTGVRPENVKNGATCDFSGFLTADGYTDRNGADVVKPLIMITEVQFDNKPEDIPDSFSQAEGDLPF